MFPAEDLSKILGNFAFNEFEKLWRKSKILKNQNQRIHVSILLHNRNSWGLPGT
jgi:hypothetical protein